ncbi:MAG: hypothetical protein H8E32_01535 [Nitrospinae bacterium]|nr:hypothetical protein [Nitrospinota bacterium]
MKRILLVVLMIFLAQSMAYAEKDRKQGGNIDKMKARMIEIINTKRGLLDNFESCIQSATSREDMKSCRKNHKEKMEAVRAEKKKMKMERKEKMKERRENREN